MNKNYTISQVASLSGLSELVIRAWENRYNAVNPSRSETKRRLYDEDDLKKLILLNKLTTNGYKIGAIAGLSLSELNELFNRTESKIIIEKDISLAGEDSAVLFDSILAIRNYDSRKLEVLLSNYAVKISRPKFLKDIIIPLIDLIGKYWQEGILKISHEHLASSVIKKILGNYIDGYHITEQSPRILITTPQGQYHEIGALITAAFASWEGWYVTYLGASLPAEEIADVVNQINPEILFLSIIYPGYDTNLGNELTRLNNLIQTDTKIIISGKAANTYKNIINNINGLLAEYPEDLIKYLQIKEKGKNEI